MDKYIINGGKPICGSIETSGMKNSAVAILFGCLLINDTCIIENVPDIIDVAVSLEILSGVGVRVRRIGKNTIELDSTYAVGGTSSYELVRKMRASYYLMGAELGRFSSAYVAYPEAVVLEFVPLISILRGLNVWELQ